jgi:hypothetical protein
MTVRRRRKSGYTIDCEILAIIVRKILDSMATYVMAGIYN